jgi:transcriptional regulator with XRE-family HTH domain
VVRRSLSPWVGAAIRERREASGLSQEELADRAGLHRTYISLVERAQRNISVDALGEIADALELRPSQLIQRAERLRQADRGR